MLPRLPHQFNKAELSPWLCHPAKGRLAIHHCPVLLYSDLPGPAPHCPLLSAGTFLPCWPIFVPGLLSVCTFHQFNICGVLTTCQVLCQGPGIQHEEGRGSTSEDSLGENRHIAGPAAKCKVKGGCKRSPERWLRARLWRPLHVTLHNVIFVIKQEES